MKRMNTVHLEISSWAGISIGAEHFYGKIDGYDASGEYQRYELKHPMSQKMATAMNKKDKWSGWSKGAMTERFDTTQEIKDRAIEVWKEHFPDGEILILGNSSVMEPKWALDGDPMIVEAINHVFDKWEKNGDSEAARFGRAGEALTSMYCDIINTGDYRRGYPPKECPLCGSDYGYYNRMIVKFSQTRLFLTHDIESGEIGGLVKGGETWYCHGCNKSVTKYVQPFIETENL